MPALTPTPHFARIVWVGVVSDRNTGLASAPRDHLSLTFAGPTGEDHGGLTRLSCSRVTAQHPKGTPIRNVRQLAIVSVEELAEIAIDMGIARVEPAWLGANLVIEGIPDFTHLPPSSRLQNEDGATVVVDMENRPCHLPAAVIDADPAGAGKGRAFRAAAKGKRGVTAWVEREGVLQIGGRMHLHIPDQPTWRQQSQQP